MATRKTGGMSARLGGARKRTAGGSDKAGKSYSSNPSLRKASKPRKVKFAGSKLAKGNVRKVGTKRSTMRSSYSRGR